MNNYVYTICICLILFLFLALMAAKNSHEQGYRNNKIKIYNLSWRTRQNPSTSLVNELSIHGNLLTCELTTILSWIVKCCKVWSYEGMTRIVDAISISISLETPMIQFSFSRTWNIGRQTSCYFFLPFLLYGSNDCALTRYLQILEATREETRLTIEGTVKIHHLAVIVITDNDVKRSEINENEEWAIIDSIEIHLSETITLSARRDFWCNSRLPLLLYRCPDPWNSWFCTCS